MRSEKGVSVVFEVARGGRGNVNKLQLPTIPAVNRRIIAGETCETVSSG